MANEGNSMKAAVALMNVTAIARYFSQDLAQEMGLSNLFVSSAGYMRAGLHYMAGMPAVLEAMEQGIAAGRSIKKPLLMVDWEDYLDHTPTKTGDALGFRVGPADSWATFDDFLQD